VLCKHEVVGSIPSGSTTLRLGVALPRATIARLIAEVLIADKSANHKPANQKIVRENITSQGAVLHGRAPCGISDIVKRRSIRVGSRKQLCGPSLSPDHFGARPSQDGRVVNDPVSEA
jgi:hypothetical protein